MSEESVNEELVEATSPPLIVTEARELSEPLQTLSGNSNSVFSLAVLPDGRLVSASHDNTIKIWDSGSGSCLVTFAAHSDDVFALAVFPDGRLASGSRDKTIKIWDSKKLLKIPEIIQILKALASNTSVKTLDLSGIDLRGAEGDIIELLKARSDFTSLNLSDTHLSLTFWQKIVDALQLNSSFQQTFGAPGETNVALYETEVPKLYRARAVQLENERLRLETEAKNQEDSVRQTAAETQKSADRAIALIKELAEQVGIVTAAVMEIETLVEICTARADTKRKSDIDLIVKLKMLLKVAAPMVVEARKQLEAAAPLEEEIKKQAAIANETLQKAEAERRVNPMAVTAIAAQAEMAAKALAEAKRLRNVIVTALEKAKVHVTCAQKAKDQEEQEIQKQLAIAQEGRRRQELLLQGKLKEYDQKDSLTVEDRALLEALQLAKKAELDKIEQRKILLEQPAYPQLKEFYLSIRHLLNSGLKADELEATGEFHTCDTMRKEKASSVVKVISRFIPLVGTVLDAAGIAVKAYAEKSKQAKAQYVAGLAPDTFSREAMVEEIAFGLCERYERQLKGLTSPDEIERKAVINRLAEVAVSRIRGYLQKGAALEPDPVTALVRAVRVTKIKKDRKVEIKQKPASGNGASVDTPSLWLDHWTAHGFFSQSGIRAASPHRTHFTFFDFEAPSQSALKEKRSKDKVYYTDVERYGYAAGTVEDARIAGMELRR